MIFDKEKLLSVYDQTKDAEPMRTQEGSGPVIGTGATAMIAALTATPIARHDRPATS